MARPTVHGRTVNGLQLFPNCSLASAQVVGCYGSSECPMPTHLNPHKTPRQWFLTEQWPEPLRPHQPHNHLWFIWGFLGWLVGRLGFFWVIVPRLPH